MMVRGLMLVIVLLFYVAYLLKAMLLARQGIKVNFLGDEKQDKKTVLFEWVLRGITGMGAFFQFVLPFFVNSGPLALSVVGLMIASFGTGIFIVAVRTMRDNWRVGFGEEQVTELVTTGIYRYSRNPAFVGFDCLYVGIAMVFPNLLTLLLAISALVLFHFQIKQEETYLLTEFGESYRNYQQKVRKYL